MSDRAQLLRMWMEGYSPVAPLPDGKDLWANEDYVCAFVKGQAIVVMLRWEYDNLRWELLQRACREAIDRHPRKGNP